MKIFEIRYQNNEKTIRYHKICFSRKFQKEIIKIVAEGHNIYYIKSLPLTWRIFLWAWENTTIKYDQEVF